MGFSVGVAFITHEGRRHLRHCLPPVLNSELAPRVVVVNSSSQDGTVELAREMGVETLVVPRRDFNHGATRELVRRYLGTDIAVMMTPDAYALSPGFLDKLIEPIVTGKAGVAYARQIPHEGADFFEAFPRAYNYPEKGEIRGRDDLPRLGTYVYFCSDSCAAWSNRLLDEVGGFPVALTAEDTYAAARLVAAGHRIAYVADAVVRHSHRYSLVNEFKRYFDTGYARMAFGNQVLLDQKDEKHGKKFVSAMISRLVQEAPLLIPYAIAAVATKYVGYKVGYYSNGFPLRLKRALSGQDYYWSSIPYLEGRETRGILKP